MKKQIRVAIFISGKGTNALNLIRYFKNHDKIKIVLIFSTRINDLIEKEAKKYSISFKLVAEMNEPWINLANNFCEEYKIDFIALAGFLKKIPSDLIEQYPNRIVNIHPSLLPKFGGKGMYGKHVHEAVIKSEEKKSGITIHFVNEEFDKGRIIAQFDTVVEQNETPNSLAEKINALEMKYFPKVLEKLLLN